MASAYSQYSPYAKVRQTWYLHHNLPIGLAPADSDQDYTIPSEYNEQPWRLSYDLYGNERLYYVFALLNPNILVDPIYDFTAGTVIQIPSLQRVQTYLNSPRRIK